MTTLSRYHWGLKMNERIERMEVISDALFDKCAEVNLHEDGTVEIKCKLGLWSISGHDIEFVRANAQHYWIQYYHDGEYDEMLTNAKAHGRDSVPVTPIVSRLEKP